MTTKSRGIGRKVWKALGSFKLSVALFVLMLFATWRGTLAQQSIGLFEAQRKYFESWFFKEELLEIGGFTFALPFPGGVTLMALLAINLLIGGIVMLRYSWSRVGVLIAHLGIVLMLAAGLVKFTASNEGILTLYEGERGDHYQSYYDWEIAIEEVVADGEIRRWIIPQDDFDDREGERTATFRGPVLPFALTVSHYMSNSRVLPKGPMFTVDRPVVDGFFLDARDPEVEGERNAPGLYVRVEPAGRDPIPGILWGHSRAPMTVQVADRTFGIELHKQRHPMPFTVLLDDFTHEYHPNTMQPRMFKSEITVLGDGPPTPVEIEMNAPLRRSGLVLFQSTWGPQNARPGDPLFSGFSVVRNPSDHWPLISCFIIAIGMLIHFGMKLVRYIDREMKEVRS